jgi:16S rRNA (guanine(966)-N(2))-methyltransferase RsmD
MRVITGTARGRRLAQPTNMDIRPSTDQVKEAIFNIIQFDVEGRRVLDLFAGSGQLGLEALSRGAEKATFVDGTREATAIITANAQKTHLYKQSNVLCMDWKQYIKSAKGRNQFDIVFLDPPYALRLLPKVTAELYDADMLAEGALVICEDEEGGLAEDVMVRARFDLVKETRYGRVYITILTPKTEEEAV